MKIKFYFICLGAIVFIALGLILCVGPNFLELDSYVKLQSFVTGIMSSFLGGQFLADAILNFKDYRKDEQI